MEEAFLEVFGKITVADALKFILALGFIVFVGKKVSEYLVKRHDAEVEKDKQLHEALEAVKKYPDYRKQSVDVQKKLEEKISSIERLQAEMLKRIEKMEKDTKHRERNKCRERLLQNFRYFTSKEKNPMQAWTRMESEAFWESFKDYESAGGNGYVHTEVQPAMNLLEVIELDDVDRVAELMRSRG